MISEAQFQVCADLNDKNADREIDGLVAAMREFGLKKGTVLTLSGEDEFKKDGCDISVVPTWKWLLQGGPAAHRS